MSIAIAIYVTGAIAWFGGMGMEAEMGAVHKTDKNPFNHSIAQMQGMLVVSMTWPVWLVMVLPSALYNWATSKNHEPRKAKT